jgi:two-component system cell cycle response regulator
VIRFTRRVFVDLAILMMGLGFMMGVIFPFFCLLLGIPWQMVMTPWFFLATIMAGIIVGATNISLARSVVGKRMRLLADRMKEVQVNLQEAAEDGSSERCTPETCSIVVDSADEIGDTALAFNQLVQALAEALHNNIAVRSFTEVLSSQLELEVLSMQALQQLLQHLDAQAGAILLESEGEMKVISSHGIRSPSSLAESDYLHRALRSETRQRVIIPEDVILDGILVDFRPMEVLAEPIVYKHVPLGAIILTSTIRFTDASLSRLDLFRNSLSLALNNALTHDRLQKLAALDPLTGIYNRRFGLARLHEEFGRAVRTGLPLGAMMFDIDHFKGVNDTYGHLAGDRVLSWVTKVARTVLREGDVFIRYGGEEFLSVLPGASREDLTKIAERLRRVVEDTFVKDGDQTIRVTVSVGAASYPESGVEGEQELVQRADDGLYTAKESGRNRVVVV